MCNSLSLLLNMQVQRSGCSLMTVVCQCTKCDYSKGFHNKIGSQLGLMRTTPKCGKCHLISNDLRL